MTPAVFALKAVVAVVVALYALYVSLHALGDALTEEVPE